LEKLRLFIEGQGGDVKVIDDYSVFPQAKHHLELFAEEAGYISKIEARRIGIASQHTGAGREKKEDMVDLSAGILLAKKLGDPVEKGSLLATIFGNDPEKVKKAAEEAIAAFTIEQRKPEKERLIRAIIS
ncbi:MAG: pyrimidine-nucleoside phosphorylase, partial [Eubacteriales bacterium]|nr:pyrimidine-nucleoside phosphorylase [Eubacteriales bacterium]